jgi:hypothetical protein
MRIPKIENYKNNSEKEIFKIKDIPKMFYSVVLLNEKDKIKFIKTIESLVRSSQEYKQYIDYLKNQIDMTKCSFFHNINNKDFRGVSIEIHHEPFTLFDITQIVLNKWQEEDKELNPLLIAEDIMKIHYSNMVGLIPLSLTVHQLVHDGKLFIPLQCVFGGFITFLEEYEKYISQDLKDMLECKLQMSKDVQSQDMSILEKKYIYLEVDGMSFPQIIEN